MRTTYVLIDYENVQPTALNVLDQEHTRVIVFIGSNQSKITVEVATTLQQMGPRAEYIRLSSSGTNALDFHIAYYVGHYASRDADAWYYIVSNDTGFDPLIQHLRQKQVRVARIASVADIGQVKASAKTARGERTAQVIANFGQRGASRPRTVKTLKTTLAVLFQKTLSDAEIAEVIADLQRKRYLTVADEKITYAAST